MISNGYTPYLWAAHEGSIEAFRILRHGGDQQQVSRDHGENALHIAARFGHLNILKYILEKVPEIDPLSRSRDDFTALHLAAREGQIDCIAELIKHGVNVDIKTEIEQQTPLHIAAYANNINSVRALLYFYADIDATDKEDYTPYDMSTNDDVKDYLFNPDPDEGTPKLFKVALQMLQKTGSEFKDFILENRDVLMYKDKNGETLLHHACKEATEYQVKFIIASKAPLNVKRYIDGRIPLHFAALRHDDAMIKLFPIDLFEEPDSTKETPHQLYDRTKVLDDQKTKFYKMVNYILEQNPENEALAIKAVKRKKTPYITREDGFSLIHYAVLAKYKLILEMLLNRKDSNVNTATNDGTTPLMLAAMSGNIEIANILLKKGANVNAQKSNGATALQFAVANNKQEMVDLLIEQGADVKIENSENGATVLHSAAMAAKTDLFIKLLPEFNDINLMCKEGTPLHFAAKMGRVEMIKYLKENGADCSLTDENGNLPLHIAAREGRVPAFKVLIQYYPDITVPGENGNNILHFATINKHNEIIEEIFTHENSKKLHVPNKDGLTPVVIAVKDYNHETLQILLKNEGDPNSTVNDETVLHYAIKRNMANVVRELVEAGCRYKKPDDVGITPIIYAINVQAYNCVKVLLSHNVKLSPWIHHQFLDGQLDIEVLKHLIANGFDINEQDDDGNTLLMLALKNNNEAFYDLLLSKKANCDIGNNDGEIPLSVAYNAHNESMIKKLLLNGANPDVKFHNNECLVEIASKKQNFSIFDYLRLTKFDPNIRGAGNNTPLHHAVISTHRSKTTDHRDLLVKKLLKYGADPNLQNDNGMTPFHLATGLPKPDTLLVFCNLKEIKPEIPNCMGRTVLHTAIEAGKKENVFILASRFPNLLEIKDNEGYTPLKLAIHLNKKECSLALLKNGAKEEDAIFSLASKASHEKLFEALIPVLNVKAKNKDGKTPLEVAILANNYEFVKSLVNYVNVSKININVPMSNGQSAVELAEDKGHEEIAQLLEEKLKSYEENNENQENSNNDDEEETNSNQDDENEE